MRNLAHNIIFCLLVTTLSLDLLGQSVLTLDQAITLSLEKHPSTVLAMQKKEAEQKLLNSSIGLPNLDVVFESPTGNEMRPGIMQFIEFPTVYGKQYAAQKQQIKVLESEIKVAQTQLKYQVKQTYLQAQFSSEKTQLYQKYDTIFSRMVSTNSLRYDVGQIPVLEKINSEAKYKSIQNLLQQSEYEYKNSLRKLALLCMENGNNLSNQLESLKEIAYDLSNITAGDYFDFSKNPLTELYERRTKQARAQYSLEKHKFLPGIFMGYLDQGSPSSEFEYRLRYGLSLPIWFWKNTGRIQSAKLNIKVQESQSSLVLNQLSSQYSQAYSQYQYNKELLEYYKSVGLALSKEIIRAAEESFKQGTINYYAYLLSIDQAFQIQLNYLEAIKNYNLSVIDLQYLSGE